MLGVIALIALSLSSWTTDLRARRSWPDSLPVRPAQTEAPGSVVIVTLDGVRWQELFLGLDSKLLPAHSKRTALDIPHLRSLISARGVALGAPGAAPFAVSGPSYVSLPGYTQLFTGRAEVPCTNNACPRTAIPTLADAVGQRWGRSQAVVLSSWPDLERAAVADSHNAVVSAGRFGGAGRELLQQRGLANSASLGERSDASPGYGDYRPDAFTRNLALTVLERHRPRLLFVGLGDTDEHAHHADYEAYLGALEAFDVWLGEVLAGNERLARAGHPVTLFITTDHGRNANFVDHGGSAEAGRTWLVATGHGIRDAGRPSEPRQLSDLAPTAAHLLGVALPGATGNVLHELF